MHTNVELLLLAEKFAELKNTELLTHRFNEAGTEITFVLTTGPKVTATKEELRELIRQAQPEEPAFQNEEVGSDGSALRASPAADGGSTPEPPKRTRRKSK